MTREVDLVSYLPAFMTEYKEIRAALEAENPEFRIVWEAAGRTLQNEFIETADEYGIGRFESMLKISPSTADTMESRRRRIAARWMNALPYTERMLLEKLTVLCGNNNFTLVKKYAQYRLELEVNLELYGQVEELERLLREMIPCNMVVVIRNTIAAQAAGCALTAGGFEFAECFLVTNDSQETVTVEGTAFYGGSFINTVDMVVVGDGYQE